MPQSPDHETSSSKTNADPFKSLRCDPRHQNQKFDVSSLKSYLNDYADELHAALRLINAQALGRACDLIESAAKDGKRIFAIGNGGSAAIADHLSCDMTKGTHVHGQPIVDTLSMTSNVALYSAIANDFGFEYVFSTQISLLGRPGDVLIAISSSGNSPNIIAALDAAEKAGMATIGLSGFSGGALACKAQVSLHINVCNYGIVEDAHQALVHVLAQFIAHRRES